MTPELVVMGTISWKPTEMNLFVRKVIIHACEGMNSTSNDNTSNLSFYCQYHLQHIGGSNTYRKKTSTGVHTGHETATGVHTGHIYRMLDRSFCVVHSTRKLVNVSMYVTWISIDGAMPGSGIWSKAS